MIIMQQEATQCPNCATTIPCADHEAAWSTQSIADSTGEENTVSRSDFQLSGVRSQGVHIVEQPLLDDKDLGKPLEIPEVSEEVYRDVIHEIHHPVIEE